MAAGSKNNFFIFSCFNYNAKLSPAFFKSNTTFELFCPPVIPQTGYILQKMNELDACATFNHSRLSISFQGQAWQRRYFLFYNFFKQVFLKLNSGLSC
jgi:hypothetical protein